MRTRNVPLHCTLGWFGLALGIAILVLGYFTATAMDRFRLQHQRLDSPAFLIIQIMDLASCALTDAAFGRFPQLPLAFAPAGVDALILLGILRDLIVDRRVHKVYLYAFPLLILFQTFCMQTYLHHSPWWVRIATALLR